MRQRSSLGVVSGNRIQHGVWGKMAEKTNKKQSSEDTLLHQETAVNVQGNTDRAGAGLGGEDF